MPKLLLADDNATIRRVVHLAFADQDMQVVAVDDGEDAIARIPGERPDVILAGIEMAKGSGYDVAAFVQGQPGLTHIPVLLMAGAFDSVDTGRAEQAGCRGILVKPIDPLHVVQRVRELIAERTGEPADIPVTVSKPIERLTPPRRDPLRFPGPERTRSSANEVTGEHTGDLPRSATPAESLDDYFNRLDAAFASLGSVGTAVSPTPRSPMPDPPSPPSVVGADLQVRPWGDGRPHEADDDLPTLDDLLSGAEPIEHPRDAVDPFDLFLPETPRPRMQADDRGNSVRLEAAPPVITDAFLDDVTRRILERLAPGQWDAAVRDIVSTVAERLVRDEIARIRRGE